MELLNIIIQIYLIIFSGFLLQRKFNLDAKILTHATLYIFAPSLIFSGLVTKPLEWNYFWAPLLFSLSSIAALIIAVIYTKFWDYNFKDRSLVNFLAWGANAGNFGLPVVYFLLGEDALVPTFLIMVASGILIFTLGAYLMARDEKEALKQSIIKILKLPLVYAFGLGIILNLLNISLPNFIINPLKIMGQAVIPAQLILLGTFIAEVKLKHIKPRIVFPSLFFKLLIMPLAALGLIKIFGISDPILAGVILLQSASPMAINCVVLSDFYNKDFKQAALSVFISTFFALITLPIFWWLLKAVL